MDSVAQGQSLLQNLYDTIAYNDDDDPENVFQQNQNWYTISQSWNIGKLPKGIPEKTLEWFARYGIQDTPDIGKITARANNPANPDVDPSFEAYVSINGGWMYITHMNRDKDNTQGMFAGGHSVAKRVHMSEWIYLVWVRAAQVAGHTAAVSPKLHNVAFANITHVRTAGTIEQLRMKTGLDEAEVFPDEPEQAFEIFVGACLVGTAVRALSNCASVFGQHVPTRISWHSRDPTYSCQQEDDKEMELEDRFLITTLGPMTAEQKAKVKEEIEAELQKQKDAQLKRLNWLQSQQ